MIKLGNVTVDVMDDQTVTTLANSLRVFAYQEQQPGQAATAEEYNMTVEQMNRTHDLAHSLLAHWLGLPASPTLYGVASGRTYPQWWNEERAVLALQSFAVAVGVDLVSVAERAAVTDWYDKQAETVSDKTQWELQFNSEHEKDEE